MATSRGTILAAIKAVEPDARRALQIADHLAAEFRRHPRDDGRYLYPVEGPIQLLRDMTVETMMMRRILVVITSTKSRFAVEAQVLEPLARGVIYPHPSGGWWSPYSK